MAAPCGIYCGYCRLYLSREKGLKKGCQGCRIQNKNCAFLMKACIQDKNSTVKFCFECEIFPCDNLKKLDRKYNKKYNTSLIKNLERIQQVGPDAWLEELREAWTCPSCGGRLCLHDAKCYDCGAPLIRE